MKNEEKIKIMQQHMSGKPIQQRSKKGGIWHDVKNPSWNWDKNEYRVALTKEEEIFEQLDGLTFIKSTIYKNVSKIGNARISMKHDLVSALIQSLDDGQAESFILIPTSNRLKEIIKNMKGE